MCKKIRQLVFVAVLIIMAGFPLLAQTKITGKVIDKQTGSAIPGASILYKGGTPIAVADHNGGFVIEINDATVFTFSSMGYQSKTLDLQGNDNIVALEQSLVALNQVVVSASRDSQSRTDAPVAITKLPAKVLDEAKATSLDQVINKVNGIYMVNLGNEQHSMSIRQPLTVKSLFLYLEDGIPIRPTGVFNHNALIEMNMAGLKTIEVIKGPASSIYGSEAIGGSINFITQSAAVYPSGKLSVQGNNLGYKRTDFEIGNTFNKLGLYASGYYADRRNGYREHSDFHKLALTVRGDYQLGEKNKITTTATLVDYYADMTGSIDSTDFYSKHYPTLHTFTYREVKALRIRSSLEHLWNDKSKITINLFYRNNLVGQNPAYRVRNDTDNAATANGEINESTYQSYGTVIQHLQYFNFADSRLISGISLDYSPNQYNAAFIKVDRNEAGKYTSYSRLDSLLANYDVNILNTALYTQFEIAPIYRLKLILAARYDRFDYFYKNYLTPDAYSGAPDANNQFSSISPKIGVTYDFGKDRGIYANYSIGFVPPQVSELYRGVKVPVLEPSLYYNYEIGGWFGFGDKGYTEVSLYELKGENEIISVYKDDGTIENGNAGETLHRGIEYALNYLPFESLRLRFGGSNANHKFITYIEEGKDYSGNTMNAAPKWMANAEAFYYPPFIKDFRIGVEWQHLGKYFMDPDNTTQYDGFDVFNLRLGYAFKGIEVWANILNMTDKLYATNASKSRFGKTYNPGEPRSYNIGIAYKLSGKARS